MFAHAFNLRCILHFLRDFYCLCEYARICKNAFYIIQLYNICRKRMSIYNDEIARLKKEYGENAKGTISYQQMQPDWQRAFCIKMIDGNEGYYGRV